MLSVSALPSLTSRRRSASKARLRLQTRFKLTNNLQRKTENLLYNIYIVITFHGCSRSTTTSIVSSKVSGSFNKIISIKSFIHIQFMNLIHRLSRWNRSKPPFRSVLCITKSRMELLLFIIQILRIKVYLSLEQVCSIMDNYTTHLFHMLMAGKKEDHLARCKMGDQLMAVTILTSIAMTAHNMQTHWRQTLICQDGNTVQYRQTKR